jgi:hypothetical protein
MPELLQEPVDGPGVIAADKGPPLERRARDQRPGRPPGIEFRGDAVKQLVDLGRVVEAFAKRDVLDLVPFSTGSHGSASFMVMALPSLPPAARRDSGAEPVPINVVTTQ